MVHCTLCNSSFSIVSEGRTGPAVAELQQTKKHKAFDALAGVPSVTNPSQEEYVSAVQKRVFDTIPHYATQSS